uniref:Uncharacterized protein n=1 Tax=Pipistrellus kuhlii TaxID=59472 RepID=A0A7J8A861_PIPKU|nr:hypothetical protein mPipKuh1_009036 [Pipistrellus kuhlii]
MKELCMCALGQAEDTPNQTPPQLASTHPQTAPSLTGPPHTNWGQGPPANYPQPLLPAGLVLIGSCLGKSGQPTSHCILLPTGLAPICPNRGQASRTPPTYGFVHQASSIIIITRGPVHEICAPRGGIPQSSLHPLAAQEPSRHVHLTA